MTSRWVQPRDAAATKPRVSPIRWLVSSAVGAVVYLALALVLGPLQVRTGPGTALVIGYIGGTIVTGTAARARTSVGWIIAGVITLFAAIAISVAFLVSRGSLSIPPA